MYTLRPVPSPVSLWQDEGKAISDPWYSRPVFDAAIVPVKKKMNKIYASYGDWKYHKQSVQVRTEEIVRTLDEMAAVGVGARQFEVKGIALSGSSGVWLGGLLSYKLNIPVFLVRKPGEGSHGPLVEGIDKTMKTNKLVLIDDFIASGSTVKRVDDALKEYGYELEACLMHGHLVNQDNEGATCNPRRGRLVIEEHVRGIPCIGRGM